MDKKKNEKELKAFLKKIKEKFPDCKILSFGSRARGDNWVNSDYDLIIISEGFKEMPWLERISEVASLWPLEFDLDIIPYTREELQKKLRESSFVNLIFNESIEVA